MIVTTEAVVLRTLKYGETSLIATLFTRAAGKIGVIAKGARDRKSRLGPSLQPMNHVTAVYYYKQTRELQLLSQCDLVRSLKGLTDDVERMAVGMAAVELVDAVTPAEEENAPLLDLLLSTLAAAARATRNPGITLYYFETRLLENLGFSPGFHRCSHCGTSLEDAASIHGLHVSQHGVVCAQCARRGMGIEPLSAPAAKILQRLQEIRDPEAVTRMTLSPQVKGEVAGVLRRLLVGHVEGLRTLRSEAVFSSLLQSGSGPLAGDIQL
jgi:DNA repair protein RecO (recombination protein O)